MLYKRGCENLGSVLAARRRDYQVERFSEPELANTFEPVLQCLGYLHAHGIVYARLTAQHIAFFDDGKIMLLDWLFDPQLGAVKPSRKQNLKDLGLLVAEAATLVPLPEIAQLNTSEIASMLLEFYSINFATAVLVLLEGLVDYQDSVCGLMNGEKKIGQGGLEIRELRSTINEGLEIKSLREKERLKQQEQKSIKIKLLQSVENEKQKLETPRKPNPKQVPIQVPQMNPDSFQSSPTKKFNITTPNKKLIRLEDTENKKVFN